MVSDQNEPTTPMQENAIQIHELYLSYLYAGFNEIQATYLVGEILKENIRAQGQGHG